MNGNVEFKFKFNDKINAKLTSINKEPYSFIVNKTYNKVFIYGKKVNDFHVLDKNKIFTYHHSAIQELDRRQITNKQRITKLENKNYVDKEYIHQLFNNNLDISSGNIDVSGSLCVSESIYASKIELNDLTIRNDSSCTYIESASQPIYIQKTDPGDNSEDKKFLYVNSGISGDVSFAGIGINTDEPRGDLEVVSYPIDGTILRNILDYTNNDDAIQDDSNIQPKQVFDTDSHNKFLSVIGTNDFWSTNGTFLTTSDERIKKNIKVINADIALDKIRNIGCYSYLYKDEIKQQNRPNTNIGFMAQDVKKTLPEAVRIVSDIIPNEYRFSEEHTWESIVDTNGNNSGKFKLTIPDLDLSGDELNGNVDIKLICMDIDLIDIDLIDIDLSKYKEDAIKVTTIKDEPFSMILDKKYSVVFVYGKKVNDFHILDKNKIFALHHSGIQELDRQRHVDKERISALEVENTILKIRMSKIETKYTDLLSRLEAVEKFVL